jgi:WD40 repeat protein
VAHRAFDARTGARLANVRGSSWEPEGHVAASASGEHVAIVRPDGVRGAVTVIDVLRGSSRVLDTFPLPTASPSGFRDGPSKMVLSDDGDALALVLRDGTLHLYAGLRGRGSTTHRTLTSDTTWSPLFGPGERLVVRSNDGSSRLMNYRTGRVQFVVPEGIDGHFSPAGDRLVTSRGELWDMVEGVLLAELPLKWQLRLLGDDVDSRWQFAWSPDGARVVAYGKDKSAYLYSIHSHAELVGRARERLSGTALTPEQRARYFLN